VKLFMEQIQPNDKTLVFCATQVHALAVRDLVNQMKASKDPDYCHRVTANDGELGNGYLRAFQNNEKTIPTILTTSQKLSTGVDARNIRNIMLMRPINSMIEFKQIVGRGTRLYDGKDYFTIYQQQATNLPRLRALALRSSGRGRAGPGQADPASAPAIPRLHRRRGGRPRPARRDRQGLQRFPEVPIRTGGGVVVHEARVLFTAGLSSSKVPTRW
jgi:hypothetical protein